MVYKLFAASNGEAVIIAVKSVFLVGAEKVTHKIIESDKARDFAVAVGDEEEKGVGTKKGVQGLLERVVVADVIKPGVEDLGNAVRIADVKVIKMGGVDAADEIAFDIFDWEMREARAIQAIKREWTENFVSVDVDDFVGGEHDARDFGIGEIEEVRNHIALALAEDAMRSLGENLENIGASFRGVVEDSEMV